MNYTDFANIKNTLNFFNDVLFLSLLNENTALVENTKTGDIWSLPFSEKGKDIIFHGENARIEEKNERVEEVLEEEEILKRSFRSILRKESSPEDLTNAIVEAMSRCKTKKNKKKNVYEEEEMILVSEAFKKYNESEEQFAIEFEERWNEKVNKTIFTIKDKLFNAGNLFETSGEIKCADIVNPIELINDYALFLNEKELQFSFAENIYEWNKKIKDILGEAASVDPFSKNLDISITKAIVESKKLGNDINNRETQKRLKEIHGELFESDALINFGIGSDRVPGSHNGENKLSFLKFHGIYTNGDLEKLCKDFDYVIGNYNSLSQDDLQNIQSLKNKAEYMYRTNTIDDEEVTKLITAFNSSYGRDSRDKYRDPNFSSGNLDNQKTLGPEIRIPAVA